MTKSAQITFDSFEPPYMEDLVPPEPTALQQAREALRPYARRMTDYDYRDLPDTFIMEDSWRGSRTDAPLTLGDHRRAAAAYARLEEEG